MLICKKCLTKYAQVVLKIGTKSCPINGCGGQLVEVPNELVTVFEELNKKGYPTSFISGLNIDKESALFNLAITFEKIPRESAKGSVFSTWKAPKGWEVKFSEMRMSNNQAEDEKYLHPKLSSEHDLSDINPEDRPVEKMEIMSKAFKTLYYFVKELPDRKEITE